MANREINVSPDVLLAAIHQHLSEQFFGSTKVFAKQLFNDLLAGKNVPLIEIASKRLGKVQGLLTLDASDFVGRLNYSHFRDALGSHLQHIGVKLKEGKGLNVFTNEDTGAVLFHIPGLVEVNGEVNVLVTGVEQSKPGEILIKLMFLDPDNFRKDADKKKS